MPRYTACPYLKGEQCSVVVDLREAARINGNAPRVSKFFNSHCKSTGQDTCSERYHLDNGIEVPKLE